MFIVMILAQWRKAIHGAVIVAVNVFIKMELINLLNLDINLSGILLNLYYIFIISMNLSMH